TKRTITPSRSGKGYERRSPSSGCCAAPSFFSSVAPPRLTSLAESRDGFLLTPPANGADRGFHLVGSARHSENIFTALPMRDPYDFSVPEPISRLRLAKRLINPSTSIVVTSAASSSPTVGLT